MLVRRIFDLASHKGPVLRRRLLLLTAVLSTEPILEAIRTLG